MSLKLKVTTDINEVARFVADLLLKHLNNKKKILFFMAGGSSIPVCVKVAEILKKSASEDVLKNLTITLTDERYGEVGHADSNLHQLMEKGFDLPGAKIVLVLSGENFDVTVQKFNKMLGEVFKDMDYKIGLFGVGKDGHTAGVLPDSIAVDCVDLVCGYSTPTFSRITITPKAIEQLDEVVVFMQGQEKWGVVKDLLEKNIDVLKQPAQVLKKVPLLTIFTDCNTIQS